MNNDELVLHQQRLIMRSGHLRHALGAQVQVFKNPLTLIDHARTCIQWLKSNPQWSFGALLVLIIMRPQRALFWAGRLWWAWKSFTQVKKWLAKRIQLQR